MRKLFLVSFLAAAMIVLPGIAYAGVGDANALNKWTLDLAPDGDGAWSLPELVGIRQAPTRGPIQSIKKNQKLFFQVNGKGTEFESINDVGGVMTGVQCEQGSQGGAGTANFLANDCASAPLKISSPGGVMVCLLNDLSTSPNSGGAEDIEMMLFICVDDTCTKERSVPVAGATETGSSSTGSCSWGAPGPDVDSGGVSLAGQTIYVIVQDRSGSADTEQNTITVWAVGQ